MLKRVPRLAIWFLGFLLFLAVFRDVLANGRPLYCRIGGEVYFPGLRTIFVSQNKPYSATALRQIQMTTNQFEAWKNLDLYDEPPIFALIPFSPGEFPTVSNLKFAKPGVQHPGMATRFRHWLGTDSDGRDVAATLVSGARVALLTGSLAMFVALFFGLSLGMLAGFFGDDQVHIKITTLISSLLGLLVAWFYAVTTRRYELEQATDTTELWISIGLFVSIVLFFNRVGAWIGKSKMMSLSLKLPLDLMIMRVAELFSSIPRLILIIVLSVALLGVSGESIWLMIVLIGALGWTSVAKFTRAELLKIRTMDYVTAARGLGMSDWRVLLRHALPNAMRPVYIVFAFGAANAVMLEAYLSFLGFGGLSMRGISWGSLFINENSTANPMETWWITVFAGIVIFFTILALNSIGEALSDK
ncbi:MAG: ABC transporter permease [Saprospiraceae bacterium]|nr:ABC transporter permease [Saprospiraceae bacterium]